MSIKKGAANAKPQVAHKKEGTSGRRNTVSTASSGNTGVLARVRISPTRVRKVSERKQGVGSRDHQPGKRIRVTESVSEVSSDPFLGFGDLQEIEKHQWTKNEKTFALGVLFTLAIFLLGFIAGRVS